MKLSTPASRTVIASILLACCGAAGADGLSDLRAALARLPGVSPLKATVQARDWRRTGEGKDAKQTQGQAAIGLEDGPRGLEPLYGRDLLARADAEARAEIRDKSAAKPLSLALAQLDFKALRALSSASGVLLREIDDARFKGETAEPWAGKPARKLQFEGNIDRLPEADRKYVRDFKVVLDVWIGADGTPLASLRHFEVSGRAFVVVTFEQHSDQQRSYAVVGDRLVATADEEKGSVKGAGESQDYRIERSLQVLP